MTFIVPRKYIRPLLKKLKREMGEATLYLWDARESFYNAKVVKVIDGVDCNAISLSTAVDRLYSWSKIFQRSEPA